MDTQPGLHLAGGIGLVHPLGAIPRYLTELDDFSFSSILMGMSLRRTLDGRGADAKQTDKTRPRPRFRTHCPGFRRMYTCKGTACLKVDCRDQSGVMLGSLSSSWRPHCIPPAGGGTALVFSFLRSSLGGHPAGCLVLARARKFQSSRSPHIIRICLLPVPVSLFLSAPTLLT